MSNDNGWYYNVTTGEVTHGKVGDVLDRMGPYPDRATAERALEIVRERNARADADDD